MSTLRHWFTPHHTNNQRAKLLHPTSWMLVLGVFLVFQIFLGQASQALPQILGYASQIPVEEIVRLTNVERTSKGFSELKYDSQLSAAAAQKASDMMAHDYWAHVSPAGTQPWFFITQSGYAYRYAGENLARDFGDPGSVVRAWMDSPTHRDNLLNNKYQDIGIAVVDGTLGGRETTLVVQMFGTKLSAGQPAVASNSVKAPVLVEKVQAAEIETTPVATLPPATPTPLPVTPTPQDLPVVANALTVSPFSLTKLASIGILLVIIATLIIDIIIVRKRKITRWTSRSYAHLVFMIFLLIAAAIVYRGQIV